jgi:hypothetical protein
MNYNKFTLILLIIFMFASVIFSRTRDEVVNESNFYSNFSWICRENNILDEYNHKESTGPSLVRGQDGVDDRAYRWDDENNKWVYSENNWPYVVGKSYTGEAYAYGYWDRYYNFGEKLSRVTEKWIAGKRPGDPESVVGYNGYTGIDCSGFVIRVLGLNVKEDTDGLTSLCLRISAEELKKGDIIVKTKPDGHAVLFVGWIDKPRLANIIHSTKFWWKQGINAWRVVDDLATVTGEREHGTLGATVEEGYYPYTPFPIFTDWSPTKDSITTGTPQIKVKIKSWTNIIANSIVMKVNGEVVPATISPLADEKEIVVLYEPQQPLCDGLHTVYI